MPGHTFSAAAPKKEGVSTFYRRGLNDPGNTVSRGKEV
jgi:hypothetical protein